MSKHDIIGGFMVAFDIFEKKDVKKVEQKIIALFGIEPETQKSHISFGFSFSYNSFDVSQNVWKTNLPEALTVFQKISAEKGFPIDKELLDKYVESLEIRGYNSPEMPFYILMANFVLNRDLLNSTEDLRKDMFLLSQPIRLFIESLDGLTNKIVGYSPRASLVTQFWVKVTREHLTQMRNNILKQISLLEENEPIKSFEIKDPTKLSKKMLSSEPFNLAPDVGDLHSQIIDGSNIILVVGQIMQQALGGLRTPYLIELSYDEKLLAHKVPHEARPFFVNLDICSLDHIVWEGYGLLITLISFSTFMSYLASERLKIEREISKLREKISTTRLSTEDLHNHLNEINNYGTQLSSLLNMLGTFSRQREMELKQIASGTGDLCFEVPIKTELQKFFPHQNEGYLRTIATQTLAILNGTKEALSNQETEIRSMQNHMSNIVNLRNIRSNNTLQKIMLIIAVSGLIIAGISGFVAYQSWRTAELDYIASHPEGQYVVAVKWISYDSSSNYDQFQVSVKYQGSGESKYVRLTLSFAGNTPILVSQYNLEVIEPNTIIGRNYVDGFVGEVFYNIPRVENTTSSLSITDYTSDVDVIIFSTV